MPPQLPSPELLRQNPETIPEAVEWSLAQARAGSDLNAFITLFDKRALDKARQVRDALNRGHDLPLAGYVMAVKDNIAISGTRLTCGSKILFQFESVFTATAAHKLEAAGAVIVGKTNLDEFAMGSSTENSYFGPAKHPQFPDRVPGGSSGGSAIAVAAGWVHASLGSETGGSVRQPAAFCGIVGLKPTYGRVSRSGLVAFGSSLDQISPFSTSCRRTFEVLRTISGVDPRDSTSSNTEAPPEWKGAPGPRLKIGFPAEYHSKGLHPEIAKALTHLTDALRKAGHTVVDVSLPHSKYAIPVYYIVATAEASSNLARFDGVRYGFRSETDGSLLDLYERSRAEGFGEEVRRRIMIGTYVLSSGYYDAYYRKAQQVRRLIAEDFRRAFSQVDVIMAPTTPDVAFRRGEKASDPLAMYLSDVYTVPANLAGIPAVSIPAGKSSDGLPIGIQFMGPWFSEDRILILGDEIESLNRPQLEAAA